MTEDADSSVRKNVEPLVTEWAADPAWVLEVRRFDAGVTLTITAPVSGPDAGGALVAAPASLPLRARFGSITRFGPKR